MGSDRNIRIAWWYGNLMSNLGFDNQLTTQGMTSTDSLDIATLIESPPFPPHQ